MIRGRFRNHFCHVHYFCITLYTIGSVLSSRVWRCNPLCNSSNLKNIAPDAPILWKSFCTKGNLRGYVAKKSALTQPQPCPLQKYGNSFCVYANGRLRRRKRLFGLTRTVAGKARRPCCNGTCTVSGRQGYTIRTN